MKSLTQILFPPSLEENGESDVHEQHAESVNRIAMNIRSYSACSSPSVLMCVSSTNHLIDCAEYDFCVRL